MPSSQAAHSELLQRLQLNKCSRGRPEEKGRKAPTSKTKAKGSVPSDVKAQGTDWLEKDNKGAAFTGKMRAVTFLSLLSKLLPSEWLAGRAQVAIPYPQSGAWDSASLCT